MATITVTGKSHGSGKKQKTKRKEKDKDVGQPLENCKAAPPGERNGGLLNQVVRQSHTLNAKADAGAPP